MSPEARACPRAVVAAQKGALRLTAVNAAAAALGLAPGLTLADARARHPGLEVSEAAPGENTDLLGSLADACERYTPLIALDGDDGLLLDVTGCAHLFGGEAELVRDLMRRMARHGLAARAALAATAGAAFALARHGEGRAVVVPAGEELAALLAPLPLAALRLEAAAVEALARLGFSRIGALYGKPRAPLAARFGRELLERLDAALGAAPVALDYRFPPPAFCAERASAEPVERVEDVLGLAAHLALTLAGALERHGMGARRLDLALFRVDGAVTRLAVGTSRPLRDPQVVRRLFAEKVAALGSLDPGFGFDLVRLSVREAAPLGVRQEGFGADADGAEALEALVDRLSARFGAAQVQRLVLQDRHVPEEACRAAPAQNARGWSDAVAALEAGAHRPWLPVERPTHEPRGWGRGRGEPARALPSVPRPGGSEKADGLVRTIATRAAAGGSARTPAAETEARPDESSAPARACLSALRAGGPVEGDGLADAVAARAAAGAPAWSSAWTAAGAGLGEPCAPLGDGGQTSFPSAGRGDPAQGWDAGRRAFISGGQPLAARGNAGSSRGVEVTLKPEVARAALFPEPAGAAGFDRPGLAARPPAAGAGYPAPGRVLPRLAALPEPQDGPAPAAAPREPQPNGPARGRPEGPLRTLAVDEPAGKAAASAPAHEAEGARPLSGGRWARAAAETDQGRTGWEDGKPQGDAGGSDAGGSDAGGSDAGGSDAGGSGAGGSGAGEPGRCGSDGAVVGGRNRVGAGRAGGALVLDRRRPSGEGEPDLCGPARPLRLLERPEPVEAVAEVPDGPPIRFLWRRVMHHVARTEGPERIAAEWWRSGAELPTRDYFRVETRTGHRFWLYRAGLYGVSAERPTWFLHGLFG